MTFEGKNWHCVHFLTLGSGTSSARNENLRPLFNRNKPLTNGNYGLRNHFWQLESRFLMRKSEKNAFFSKPSNIPLSPLLWDEYTHKDSSKPLSPPSVYFVRLESASWLMWSDKNSPPPTRTCVRVHTNDISCKINVWWQCHLGRMTKGCFLSPSGDLGIGLVWDNNRTPQLFGPTVEILFKQN